MYNDKIKELRNKISEANSLYRTGNPIMSDDEFDELLDSLYELSPNDNLLNLIGYDIKNNSRKSKLPIPMASMNKVKNVTELKKWEISKKIDKDEIVIITPKYDGLSLCVNESNKKDAYTRGNGEYGQKSNTHYEKIDNKLSTNINDISYSIGEVIMPKYTFNDKYSDNYSNSRNLVSGLLNSDKASDMLMDCHYIKYNAILATEDRFITKQQILDYLNNNQEHKVKYKIYKLSDLTDEILISLYNEFSDIYEIDGLIIEINDINIQKKLGKEKSNNPAYARAYKNELFEKNVEAEVLNITWNISKRGLLKPTINIKPVVIDNVTVSNITGNNARFIENMGIGIGAKLLIKRSGSVIPKVVKTLERVEFVLPKIENYEIKWDKNSIDLVTTTVTENQNIKRIIAFFDILSAENISSGIINNLYNEGFKTIKDFLNIKVDDLLKIKNFSEKRSKIIYESIQKCITDVELHKLQHASGIFDGLGSKKLALLSNFTEKPKIEDLLKIDGFSHKSANLYIDNYDNFLEFLKDLNIKIKKQDNIEISDNLILSGKTFVFTQVRMPNEEKILKSNGAIISENINKNTSYLICSDKNKNTNKIEKAKNLGIEILNVDEFLVKFIN